MLNIGSFNYDNVIDRNVVTINDLKKINSIDATKKEPTKDIPIEKPNNADEAIKKADGDVFDYSKDDGIISTKDKLINIGKGIIRPVTNMFSSQENFLKGAATIAGCGALCIATGGAIMPLLVATGVVTGGIQLGKSIYELSNAKTDNEAIEALQGIGEGVSITGLSVAGAKTSLKSAGTSTESLNPLSSVVKCFKEVPNSIRNSLAKFGFKPKKAYKEVTVIREIPEDQVPDWAKAAQH